MHGAALVRIPNPFAKSEATPSRPFVDSRNRLRFAEPAGCIGCFLHRHPGEGGSQTRPTGSLWPGVDGLPSRHDGGLVTSENPSTNPAHARRSTNFYSYANRNGTEHR